MTSIQIFNIILNGDDVKAFCEMTKEQKIAFIKSNSNQKNDDIINEFLSQPFKVGDCGCGCGGTKKANNGNIGTKDAIESSKPIARKQNRGNSTKDSSK